MNILFKFIADQMQWLYVLVYGAFTIVIAFAICYLFFNAFKRK